MQPTCPIRLGRPRTVTGSRPAADASIPAKVRGGDVTVTRTNVTLHHGAVMADFDRDYIMIFLFQVSGVRHRLGTLRFFDPAEISTF